MNKHALAPLFYRALQKMQDNPDFTTVEKAVACRDLIYALFEELTRTEKLHFSTHFARISYVGHKYQIDRRVLFHLHHFRHLLGGVLRTRQAVPELWTLGRLVALKLIHGLLDVGPPPELARHLTDTWPLDPGQVRIKAYLPYIRVVVLEDDADHQQLLARTEERPDQPIRIQYGLPDRNAFFQPTIELLRRVVGLPCSMNLLDVEIDEAGLYRPRGFVLEPDYLIDVTAVASAYQGKHIDQWGYLLRKFLPFRTSVPLMVGNIANYFLDELMSDVDTTFVELQSRIFSLDPLAFCCFDNRDVRKMMEQSQKHYVNLRKVIAEDLPGVAIDATDCYLEPSFYTEQYGLQGRLDLLYRSDEGQHTAIVELKSGQPFMANVYGISPAHFTQTLLYDLLIRSAFGKASDPANYMLYSGEDDRHLRFAPAARSQQLEAIQVRNQLLAIEYLLADLGTTDEPLTEQGDRLFARLRPEKFPHLKGFNRDNLETFRRVYDALRPVERAYFTAFGGFIAREHRIAKTGIQGRDNANGLATLWLDSRADKDEQYRLLQGLCPIDNRSSEAEPLLTFLRTERSNPLANFRQGDIAVLYPTVDDAPGVLRNQIFRCSVVAIDAETVTVRLRARQFNDRMFRQITEWSLEPDLLDSSFNMYYRGLFALAAAPARLRSLLLTERAPGQAPPLALDPVPGMTPEQFAILGQMLVAPDYFLLWGPPGTGKTSVMLHHLVGHLLAGSQEQILLLAYTNRAVDEICESIEALHSSIREQYIRIGSRYGTGAAYQDRLLRHLSAGIKKRSELRALIDEARIIVGTVASVVGKPELFRIKQFDRVIIDEASQILEPMLMGLLTLVPRFVLIGDHRQLPAVVQQEPTASTVRDEALQAIGLQHLHGSYFERLYERCQAEGWDWAYAQLSQQGRMHEEVMRFPSRQFYANNLQVLPDTVGGAERQRQPLQFSVPDTADAATHKLASRRLLFFPTPIDTRSVTAKTNRYEAERIGDLVEHFRWLYAHNDRVWTPTTLGIITPYRAQIAQIRQVMYERELDPALFTIDTVERYQGGARDIILISLCTNSGSQVSRLTSLSSDGIDRKLNVAMTRARERLIILGNPALLQSEKAYAALLQHCYSEDAWVEEV